MLSSVVGKKHSGSFSTDMKGSWEKKWGHLSNVGLEHCFSSWYCCLSHSLVSVTAGLRARENYSFSSQLYSTKHMKNVLPKLALVFWVSLKVSSSKIYISENLLVYIKLRFFLLAQTSIVKDNHWLISTVIDWNLAAWSGLERLSLLWDRMQQLF